MSGLRRRGPVVGVFVQKEENSNLWYSIFYRAKFVSLTYLQDEAMGECGELLHFRVSSQPLLRRRGDR